MDGVDEAGNIRVKQVTQILKNGEAYGTPQYHRHVLAPGDDLTGQEPHINAMATAVWTPEKVQTRSAADIVKINTEIDARKAANAKLQIEIDLEKTRQAALDVLKNKAKP